MTDTTPTSALPTELTVEQLGALEAGETLEFSVAEREALLPALSAVDGLETHQTGHSFVMLGNPTDADWNLVE
jgi:hypothetical protein